MTPEPGDGRRRYAMWAISVLFLALMRTLAEVYRLRLVQGRDFTFTAADPFIRGAMLAAGGCWLAVGLFFLRRYAWAVAAVLLTIGLMLAYKLLLLG